MTGEALPTHHELSAVIPNESALVVHLVFNPLANSLLFCALFCPTRNAKKNTRRSHWIEDFWWILGQMQYGHPSLTINKQRSTSKQPCGQSRLALSSRASGRRTAPSLVDGILGVRFGQQASGRLSISIADIDAVGRTGDLIEGKRLKSTKAGRRGEITAANHLFVARKRRAADLFACFFESIV